MEQVNENSSQNESNQNTSRGGWLQEGGAENIFFGLVAFLIIMGIGLYTKDWMTAILVGAVVGIILWLFFRTPVGKKIIDTLMNFFMWCGGIARTDFSKISGKDQLLYAGIGMALFVPFAQAFYNGYMTSTVVYLATAKKAALAALFVAIIVFVVDRMFIVTMKRDKNMKYKPYSLALRIAFAVFLGIVLSLATEINLFKSEIQEEYVVEMDEAKASIDSSETAELAGIQKKMDAAQGKVESRYNDFMAEVDQNIGGRKANYGPVAKKKEKLWQEAKADYENNILPALQQDKDEISEKYAKKRTRMEDNFSYGFASRVEYLMKAGERHPSIGIMHLFILILMILIDIVPVLAKSLMEPTQYEYELAAATAEWEKKMLDKQVDLETADINHQKFLATENIELEKARQQASAIESARLSAIMQDLQLIDRTEASLTSKRDLTAQHNFIADRVQSGEISNRANGSLWTKLWGKKRVTTPPVG